MSEEDLSDEAHARFAARDATAAALVECLLSLGDDFTLQAAAETGKSPDDGGAGRAQMAICAVIRGLTRRQDARHLATARGIAGGLVAGMLEADMDCTLFAYAHDLFHHIEGTSGHPLAQVKPEGSA